MQDRIQVNDFHLSAVNILDCWSVNTRLNPRYKPHAQPVILNLTLLLDHAIKSSDLLRLERIIDYSNSIDYSHIDKLITSLVTSLPPSSTIPSLAAQLATTLLKTYSPIKSLHITLEAPRLLICADSTWVDLHKTRLGVETSTFSFKLPLLIIIGCSAKERHQPQRLIITIILDVKCLVGSRLHYREICDSVITYTQASRFKTVEALCLSIARLCIVDCVQDTVSVKIEKLNCMNFARAFSYQVSRSISDFPGERVVLDERDFALVIVTGPSEDIKAAVSELGLDVFESSFLYHDGLNNVMILKTISSSNPFYSIIEGKEFVDPSSFSSYKVLKILSDLFIREFSKTVAQLLIEMEYQILEIDKTSLPIITCSGPITPGLINMIV